MATYDPASHYDRVTRAWTLLLGEDLHYGVFERGDEELAVATHVLAFEGDSQVTWFEGNFAAYEEHRRAQLGAEADRPHRISYKKLVRS